MKCLHVISGDLADKGDPAAYQWLKTRLDKFPLKTFLMMGNHDDRDAFRAVLETAPNDLAARLEYAHMLEEIEDDGWYEETARYYEGILDEGIEMATMWYVTAAYRRSQIAFRGGTDEEARQFKALFDSLTAAGFEAPAVSVERCSRARRLRCSSGSHCLRGEPA